MKLLCVLAIVALALVESSIANDLIVGTSYNTRLTWQQKAEYMGIPFKKRVKELFYSDPGQQIIKGIVARETEHTEAIASITAGGVGFTFVNIRFKSQRGSGINYSVEVYV